ncbi:hypothetical protein ACFL5F_00705 [Planctomycetota bacterium]
MIKSARLDERGVSWKILLTVGPDGRICAIGLGEGELAGLARSYGNVDTDPVDDLEYDAVIIGDKGGDTHDLNNLISRIKPAGIFVNAGRKCAAGQLKNTGLRYSRHYAALPPEKPRLFIPLASRKLRSKGLAFHSPGSFKARAGLAAAKGLNLLGIKGHLEKHVIRIHAKDEDVLTKQGLMEWLAKKLGYPIIDLVIYAGSESPRRKITALAVAAESKEDIVVKIADTEPGIQAIKQESEALRAIEDSPLSSQGPRLICEGQWNSYYVQLQEKIIGVNNKQTASLTSAHLDFLSQLSAIDRRVLPFKQTNAWHNIENWAGVTSSIALPKVVRSSIEKVLSGEFADKPIICHRTHGDFAPWNIKINKGKLFVYDWEDSLSDGLVLTDIFHFLYRQASLVGPWPGAQKLLRDMSNVSKRFLDIAGHEAIEIDAVLTIWLLSEYSIKPSDFLCDMLGVISECSQ